MIDDKQRKKMTRSLEFYDGTGVILSSFMLMLVASIIVTLVGQLIFDDGEYSTAFNYISSMIMQLFLFAGVALYNKISKTTPFKTIEVKGKLDYKQVLFLVGITVLCVLAFAPLARIFMVILEAIGFDTSSGTKFEGGVGMFFAALVVFALFPAICEEILFRGTAAVAMSKKSYAFSMVTIGVIFGMFHLNATQLVHQSLLGMVLVYVFFVTRSFWAAFTVHFVNNIIALILSFSTQNVVPTESTMTAGQIVGICFALLAFSLIMIIVLLCMLRVFTAYCKKKKFGKAEEKTNHFVEACKDFGRAFYPKGIRKNWLNLNVTMKSLYETDMEGLEKFRIQIQEEEKLESATTEEELEYLNELKKVEDNMSKKRNRNSQIALWVVIGGAWLFFFIFALTSAS